MVAAALNDRPNLRTYSRPCHRFQLSPRRSFCRFFHRLSNTTIIGYNNFRITYYIMYTRSSTIYKTYIYIQEETVLSFKLAPSSRTFLFVFFRFQPIYRARPTPFCRLAPPPCQRPRQSVRPSNPLSAFTRWSQLCITCCSASPDGVSISHFLHRLAHHPSHSIHANTIIYNKITFNS